MSTRFQALFEHVSGNDSDSQDIKALKTTIMLEALRAEFDLSAPKIKQMAWYMVYEMNMGLMHRLPEDPKILPASTLKMIPSYVYRVNPDSNGSFFALDLGGTNFRVNRMKIIGNMLQYFNQKVYTIPVEHMRGNAEGLFGFLAEKLAAFLKEIDYHPDAEHPDKLGFTFSFPCAQSDINHGSLVAWTKGFSTQGVVGKDVCALLQNALNKKGVKIEIAALCNDTVGTLVTRYFTDRHAEVGLILGTGVNGCYWERCDRIVKDPVLVKHGDKEMCINMEFGNFDSSYIHVLPITTFDQDIDQHSLNPGQQIFEKMISGMYLGEIARRILVSLSKCGAICPSFKQQLDRKDYVFTAKDCGEIAGDVLPGLFFTKEVLLKNYGIDCTCDKDRYVVREVCQLVGKRSAQLAGMAIGASLLKTGKSSHATIAVDGSLYEYVPYYEDNLLKTIKIVAGDTTRVKIELTKDGSCLGAGYIAALTAKSS